MHRFFQMWQQTDKGKNDLFVWVNETVGIGSQNFFPGGPIPGHTFQGGETMGFFNINPYSDANGKLNKGDAPAFKQLADDFAISDNHHQFIMGGTGANFISLVTGDVGFYTKNEQAAVTTSHANRKP